MKKTTQTQVQKARELKRKRVIEQMKRDMHPDDRAQMSDADWQKEMTLIEQRELQK